MALAITTEGIKIPLGLWEGSAKNPGRRDRAACRPRDRGLDVGRGVLCVLDGSKALRKAVRDMLGYDTPVRRCIRHQVVNQIGTGLMSRPQRFELRDIDDPQLLLVISPPRMRRTSPMRPY